MRSLILAVICSAALHGFAQNNVPRATSTNPPAITSPAARPGGSTATATGITGVPRYRAGFRGPANKPAPATPAEITRVGEDGAINPGDAALPLAQFRNNSLGLSPGTPISVRLLNEIDSGNVRNGDLIRGTLAEALPGVPSGSSVDLTVVSSAAAGQMTSAGELSIQVIRINGVPCLSQVITAEGQEGERLTPDAAPARGTEAKLGPDKSLVLPAA